MFSELCFMYARYQLRFDSEIPHTGSTTLSALLEKANLNWWLIISASLWRGSMLCADFCNATRITVVILMGCSEKHHRWLIRFLHNSFVVIADAYVSRYLGATSPHLYLELASTVVIVQVNLDTKICAHSTITMAFISTNLQLSLLLQVFLSLKFYHVFELLITARLNYVFLLTSTLLRATALYVYPAFPSPAALFTSGNLALQSTLTVVRVSTFGSFSSLAKDEQNILLPFLLRSTTGSLSISDSTVSSLHA